MRLIDAEKLKHHYAWWGQDYPIKEIFDEIIHRQPTVDAEIVKHGKWISGAEDFTCRNYKYECSCCECYFNLSDGDGDYYYCPNCGAKMDLE